MGGNTTRYDFLTHKVSAEFVAFRNRSPEIRQLIRKKLLLGQAVPNDLPLSRAIISERQHSLSRNLKRQS